MAKIFSNLLSRRSKRELYETQLDSTYGDMKITSPTSKPQAWHPMQSRMDVRRLGDITPKSGNVVTINEETRPPPSGTQPPKLTQIFDFEGNSISSGSNASYLPTPNHTPLHSPSETAQQTPPACTRMGRRTYVATNPSVKLNDSSQENGSRVNALAIYGLNSPVSEVASPCSDMDNASVNYQVTTSAPVVQTAEHMATVPPSQGPFPKETSALAHHHGSMNSSLQLQSQTEPRQQYASLNAATIQSLHSPMITFLSPVAEVFSVSGVSQKDDGIWVIDGTQNEATQQVFQASVTRLQQLPGREEYTAMPALKSFPNKHSSQQQSNCHNKTSCAGSLQQTIPAIHDNDLSVDRDPGETVWQTFEPCSSSLTKSNPGCFDNIIASPSLSVNHSTPHEQMVLDPFPDRSCEKPGPLKSSSPPVGTTSSTGIKSPPLGATARMRVHSPPQGSDATWVRHSRGTSLEHQNAVLPKLYSFQSASEVRRQRSASLEPPPTPSLMEGTGKVASQVIPKPGMSSHRRLRSEHLVHDPECPMGQHASHQSESINHTDTTKYHTPQSLDYTAAALAKRSRSQITLESPDLRKRQAFSDSPPLGVNGEIIQPAAGNVYDQIRNDYRTLSRETRIAKNKALLAQFAATAAPPDNEKRKQKSRARSVSRATDTAATTKPQPDVRCAIHNAQLVPSYDEMWS